MKKSEWMLGMNMVPNGGVATLLLSSSLFRDINNYDKNRVAMGEGRGVAARPTGLGVRF